MAGTGGKKRSCAGKKKIIGLVKNNMAFALFALVMAIYYGWRMFALEPWYDELYTYYSFISRGPVYAAIHWPVPNNHVFYSVLSGFFMIFENPYIALRGVSWLFSVGNLIMLYYLAGRFFSKTISLGCVFLYSSFYLVNYISIQGRGYTLSVGLYLLALIMLYHICMKEKAKGCYYVFFSLALTAGLYTVPSNIYWVLPLCLTGGLYLLCQKEIRTLLRLVVASLVAAINTLGLYSIIWLAIGSNLLSKTADSGYFGIHQVKIILKVPFQAWKRGMDYMLASPYVQSIDRERVISEFFGWVRGLMNLFVSSFGNALTILLAVSMVLCLAGGIKAFKQKKKKRLFLYLYTGSMLWGLPLILVVQSVQPYYRVFTFLGVLLALLFVTYLSEIKKGKWEKGICAALLIWACIQLFSPYYNGEYGDREIKIKEIWEMAEIEEVESICFMDDYQKYVLQFYWNLRPQEAALEEAQYILLPKELMKEDEVNEWPILYNHEGVNWEYLSTCQVLEETKDYILYRRN
ncbi:MAG: glycosyltransferase family 39 protein [Lachnospiraceae bacterium]|nr:glycosyltransferase family 39 protein [Lachnospiraceae bacterium]